MPSIQMLTMPNYQLTKKQHPSYKRKWSIYFFNGWIPFAIVIASMHIFDIKKENYLHDPLIILSFIIGALWLLGTIVFQRKLKCPECNERVKAAKYTENRNIRLICKNCSIEWDTNVQEACDT